MSDVDACRGFEFPSGVRRAFVCLCVFATAGAFALFAAAFGLGFRRHCSSLGKEGGLMVLWWDGGVPGSKGSDAVVGIRRRPLRFSHLTCSRKIKARANTFPTVAIARDLLKFQCKATSDGNEDSTFYGHLQF